MICKIAEAYARQVYLEKIARYGNAINKLYNASKNTLKTDIENLYTNISKKYNLKPVKKYTRLNEGRLTDTIGTARPNPPGEFAGGIFTPMNLGITGAFAASSMGGKVNKINGRSGRLGHYLAGGRRMGS